MKEHPILFSAPMVRAILDGAKTQTRRVVRPQPRVDEKGHFLWKDGNWGARFDGTPYTDAFVKYECPYGVPGDRLWVRETWTKWDGGIAYRADTTPEGEEFRKEYGVKWVPSIHMPRKRSRITLEVVSVRVERLHDTTEEDARAEGVSPVPVHGKWVERSREAGGHWSARKAFYELWESINGAGSWDANPWVWVVEFRRAA